MFLATLIVLNSMTQVVIARMLPLTRTAIRIEATLLGALSGEF
jgi:hypothetical protein